MAPGPAAGMMRRVDDAGRAELSLAAGTLLPAQPDPDFDRFARLGTTALGTPVALVSMVSRDGQVFPGAVGPPQPWQTTRRTPLSHSFCQHVVTSGKTFVVEDARLEPLVADSPAIPELGVVAYAGAPLRLTDPVTGQVDPASPVVGVLCAIDDRPRRWTHEQLAVLQDLAAACSAELSLRLLEERTRLLLSLAETLGAARTAGEVATAVAAVTRARLGGAWSGLLLHEPAHRRLRPVEPATVPQASAQRDVVGLDAPLPAAAAARERRSLLFADGQSLRAAFPDADASGPLPVLAASAYLPLLAGEELLGVLVLVWDSPRPTLEAEADVWSALARFTAQAVVRARLDAERRSRAEVLQRSLLPRLPEVEGLLVRGRYLPASREESVGGDWYDVVVRPDGDVALVIGDVAGHDVVAAATMGQVRGLLRAFVWDRPEAPPALVSRLERALPGLGVEGLATLVLARVGARDPATGTRRLRWTNAGHPPPLLLLPDGGTRLLSSPPDLLVGLLPDVVRAEHSVDVPAGSTLLLYTDGLIEHRGRSLAGGVERARAVLGRCAGLPPAQLLDTLLTELLGGHAEDDCALLAVRFP